MRTDDPEVLMLDAERRIKLAVAFEEARRQSFLRTADALLAIKSRDPDEIEKRKNNRMERFLKGVIGGSVVLGLGGGLASILLGSNIMVIGILLIAGCLGLAMAGPLASGRPISSGDVIEIVRALRSVSTVPEQGPTVRRRRR
jgi:hypothetical protein